MSRYLYRPNRARNPVQHAVGGAVLGVVGLLAGVGILSIANHQSDPCATELHAPDDNGRNVMLRTPGGTTFWVEAFFDNPDDVRVIANGENYQYSNQTIDRSRPEIQVPVDSTSELHIDVTPDSVTASCQSR